MKLIRTAAPAAVLSVIILGCQSTPNVRPYNTPMNSKEEALMATAVVLDALLGTENIIKGFSKRPKSKYEPGHTEWKPTAVETTRSQDPQELSRETRAHILESNAP